jgi:signal transduction histidine kinase
MVSVEQVRSSWRAWLGGDDVRVGPWWVTYAWTLVFGLLCAVGFTILNIALNAGDPAARLSTWPGWFRINLIISLSIALSIRLMFSAASWLIGRARLRGWRKGRRSLYYLVVPILGMALGWPLGMYWALGVDPRRRFLLDRPEAVFASIALALLITFVFVQFFSMKARQIQAENQATEARLRLLQAQIEPHFLFNTLANVVSLMDGDTPRAKAMLESFVDYLRASLTGFGHGTHTVGDEIDLVEAYLRIIKMRMEDRLRYEIDVPSALRSRALPALSLQPLVENAVVHGLEPQIGGGTIRVAAALERGLLVLTVEDDGIGAGLGGGALAPAAKAGGNSGTALANIRERLRQVYGDAAVLGLEAVAPHGVRARLALPATPVPAAACRGLAPTRVFP